MNVWEIIYKDLVEFADNIKKTNLSTNGVCNCRSCKDLRRTVLYDEMFKRIDSLKCFPPTLLFWEMEIEVLYNFLGTKKQFREYCDILGREHIFGLIYYVAEINIKREDTVPNSKRVFCQCCGKILNRNLKGVKSYKIDGSDMYLCSDCRSCFSECHICNSLISQVNTRIISVFDEKRGQNISVRSCSSCFDTLAPCNICGAYVKSNDIQIISGELVGADVQCCSRCKENRIKKCTMCGEFGVHQPQLGPFAQRIRARIIRREGDVCNQCICYATDINEYNFRPIPIFNVTTTEKDFPDTLFFGLEFEVERMENGKSRERASKEVRKFFPSRFVYVKRDGSLRDGIEIVTQPFTWSFYKGTKEMWSKFYEVLSNIKYSSATTTGFHVHLSKPAFSSYHLYKFISFIYNKKNRSFIRAISDRTNLTAEREGRYFRFDDVDMNNLTRLAKDKINCSHDPHHSVVNLSNVSTVEIRFFEMPSTVEIFYKNMEFLYSLYNFSRDYNLKSMNYNDLFSYVFLKENKNKYRNLCQYISKNERMHPYNQFHNLMKLPVDQVN